MSRSIYEGYGQDFLKTFAKHWPRSVRCVIYTDGPVANAYEWDRFMWLNTAEVVGHDEWMEKIRPFPLMHGNVGGGDYSIQFDARQCRKAFIECHAVEQFGGKVFWIDADVYTFADVPPDFLDKCLPDDKLSCFLGRDGWFYTESGFIGFNADHPACDQFVTAYRNIFNSGAIFTQHGWHDCYGYDVLRKGAPAKWFKDLYAGLPKGNLHPFISSPLGAVMDHRKGARKDKRSSPDELVIERSEPYWQKIITA